MVNSTPVPIFAALIAVAFAATAIAVVRNHHCRHQFGRPTSGYVCCLRCTRRFPIQQTALGEWQIGKTPLAIEPPGHPPK
ncbi:MAG TPA: hypothetical protein VN709_10190 [Terriglobales bacterium]|nr:hypothetical protein [Terriglobales bacterium]